VKAADREIPVENVFESAIPFWRFRRLLDTTECRSTASAGLTGISGEVAVRVVLAVCSSFQVAQAFSLCVDFVPIHGRDRNLQIQDDLPSQHARSGNWIGALAGTGPIVGDIVSPATDESDWTKAHLESLT
jgi:hypothetical protein